MILADLGADVLKVERPGHGDDTRGWGPPFAADGRSAYFLSVNRNKLSVAADLSAPPDVDWIRDMIADADVVVDNFRRGSLANWGLEPLELLREHPNLIWCTITGFGADSERLGYDFVAQAESGWMAINGEPHGGPMRSGVALVDVMTGRDAAVAILAALIGRTAPSTAAGTPPAAPSSDRHLVVSLQHSGVAALANVAQNVLVSGRDAARWGNAHPNLVPYELFDALDRSIVIAVGSDAQFLAAMRVLGLTALADDERYRTNAGRVAHRDAVVGAMRERVRTRAADEWLRALDAAGVPCGVVKSVMEALQEVEASPITGVAPLAPAAVRRPPPFLDEHGALVREHGWGAFSRA